MQRNVMRPVIRRRLGVSVINAHIVDIRRARNTPAYHDDTVSTTTKVTNAQTLAFLQSEDVRFLTKVEVRLSTLRDNVVRNRDLVSFPKTFQPEGLPSIPPYCLGVQRSSASETLNAADKMLERINYLGQHLDDLKCEPYPIPGENVEQETLEWERKVRRASKEQLEQELESTNLEVKGMEGQIHDSLRNLDDTAQGFESSRKGRARDKAKQDLLAISANRYVEDTRLVPVWENMNSARAREKKMKEKQAKQTAAPLVANETKAPHESQVNEHSREKQSEEQAEEQADGQKQTDKQTDEPVEKKATEKRPAEKKKVVRSSLRDVQARLEQSFRSSR